MKTSNLTFNEGQLRLIRSCATECIGDGTPTSTSDEWAVFEMLKLCHGFAADQLVIMHLIAKQCEQRRLGAMSVYDCAVAFNAIYADEDLAAYPAVVERVLSTVAGANTTGFESSTVGGARFIGPFSLN